jgi:predicted alpha/beta-hydrolase family hydrolase
MRWEFPYMREGRARPDSPTIAEAAVRRAWLAAADRFADLPRFAGGKSFGGRMTSRAHAAEPLPGLHGIVFFGFPLHPPNKPGIERAEHLASAGGPLLFLQGTRDELADLLLLAPVVARLGQRARLHIVDDADHGFDVLRSSGRTREQVLEELARITGAWITEVLTLESARR